MKLILSAGSLHHLPLTQVFTLARLSGFDGVEVIINHDFAFNDGVEILTQLQKIHPINSIHAPFFQIDGWGDKAEQLKKTVQLAAATGVSLITFHPPAWFGLDFKFWGWMKRISDFQKEIGRGKVTIALENMPVDPELKFNPYHLAKPDRLIGFVQQHNLMITFDSAHMGSMKTDFLHDFHILHDSGRIRNIHFSDFGQRREHLLPGHGVLPLTRFLNHLREKNYRESLVLELAPEEFPSGEEQILTSLIQLQGYLQKETGGKHHALVTNNKDLIYQAG